MSVFKGWRIPPRRVALWHAVSALPLALVVCLGGYLTYHHHVLSAQSRERVDRAYEVLGRIDALFVSVEDAAVAQREYIITGNAADLVPFQAALQGTAPSEEQLRQLLLDSRPQLDRLSRLEQAIAAKLAELGQTITLRRTQGFEAARAAIAHGGTNRLMDRVREEALAMSNAEQQLLATRQAAERAHGRAVLMIGIVLATLSVVTRIGVALFLAHLRKQGKPAPFAA